MVDKNSVNGFEPSHVIEGTGIPCIVIGDAKVYQNVFSLEMKKHFKLIFLTTALYRSSDFDLENYTMDNMLHEVEQTRRALDLDKVSVLGISYTSLVALEYAKKYPDHTSHVIMIAMTPGWNVTFIKEQEKYWLSQASEERKVIMEQNIERLPDAELNNLDPSTAFIAMCVRNAPMRWFDPTYDATWILEGVQWNTDLMNHVMNVIFPEYNFMSDLECITMPVFLALGQYDFGVPYYLWDDYKDRIPDLSYYLFERSGHWPMFEEQSLFDEKLIAWLQH
ncbi:MAG: alpha/beta fold hydrolase [Promethearchaeota archaeon]|jgi:proline iminopeptidase